MASDTIGQRYGVMRFGITASQIRENVYACPTFSSDIGYMLGHARDHSERIAPRYGYQSQPVFPSTSEFGEADVIAGQIVRGQGINTGDD